MIKYFKKIRQTFLIENKFSKYLIYAVGEILIIAIGVLFAVQINNWNESGKLKTREVKMIKEFRTDLIQGLNDLDFNISDLKTCLNSNLIILNQIENKLPYHDSLDYHFSMLYPYIIFSANQTTYENAKETGLHIISNEILRKSISDLYGNLFNIYRVSEEDYLIKHYHDYIKPMLVSEFTTYELRTSAHPKNYSEFVQNSENKQILNFTIETYNGFIAMQTSLRTKVEGILDLIEEEIGE